jgi:hypothetical protein
MDLIRAFREKGELPNKCFPSLNTIAFFDQNDQEITFESLKSFNEDYEITIKVFKDYH